MAFNVYLQPEAIEDYNEAIDWYNAVGENVCARFCSEVGEALEALESQATFYSYFRKPYRRILLRSFPYRVVYGIEDTRVLVYAINHNRKENSDLRQRLP